MVITGIFIDTMGIFFLSKSTHMALYSGFLEGKVKSLVPPGHSAGLIYKVSAHVDYSGLKVFFDFRLLFYYHSADVKDSFPVTSEDSSSYCQHLFKHHLLFSCFLFVNYDAVIAFAFPSRITKYSMGKLCRSSSLKYLATCYRATGSNLGSAFN